MQVHHIFAVANEVSHARGIMNKVCHVGFD